MLGITRPFALTPDPPPRLRSNGSTDGPTTVHVEVPRSRRVNAQGHRLPMSPQYALKEFGHKLSSYEQKEIMEYPEVWFLGMDAKKVDGVLGAAQNSGMCSLLITVQSFLIKQGCF